jgi:transposase InsO family protein
VACASIVVEHRLAPPRHPQTNCMVERFNGHISELQRQTRFESRGDLEGWPTRRRNPEPARNG